MARERNSVATRLQGRYWVRVLTAAMHQAKRHWPRTRDRMELRRQALKLRLWPEKRPRTESGVLLDVDWSWIKTLETLNIGELQISDTIGGCENIRVVFFVAHQERVADPIPAIWVLAAMPRGEPTVISQMSCIDEYQPILTRLAARLVRAYLECSDEMQQVIRDMVQIVEAPDADEDEREMAFRTIEEALFPVRHDKQVGVSLDDVDALAVENQPDGVAAQQELDREEASFAENLRRVMEEKRITQVELAKLSGVGQSAISMMLSRNCRPQRRTVAKLAAALGVERSELWPGT